MKSSVILISVFGSALAAGQANNNQDGNNDHTGPPQGECRQIQKWNRFLAFAANTSDVEAATHNNATRDTNIKQGAERVKAKLARLQANTTLIGLCPPIWGYADMQRSCDVMHMLTTTGKIVADDTLLAQITHNNNANADKLKAFSTGKQAELQALQSNQTHMAFCSNNETENTCRRIIHLEKGQALGKNSTELEWMFHGDQLKADVFQYILAEDAKTLDTLKSNTTLMSSCNNLHLTTDQLGKVDNKGTTDSGTVSSTAKVAGASSGATVSALGLLVAGLVTMLIM